MPESPFGLLIMAYGTPRTLDEVPAYYTHIRHGRPPTPELLDNLVSRYQSIGGVSPLNAITREQATRVAALVNADGGRPCRLFLGLKHASPFIEEAVAQMATAGIRQAVTLVLAPHYSTMSVASYQQAAVNATTDGHRVQWAHIDQWHVQPRYLSALAKRVQAALLHIGDGGDVPVVFTAHSLPERILAVGDPYAQQLRETGDAIARMLGLPIHQFAWQSAGRTPETWLGPDILDHLRGLADAGHKRVVVCPCGFVSDHLEVLYDIDIEAQALARELNMTLVRTASLNTDDEFMLALAEVVRHASAQLNGGTS